MKRMIALVFVLALVASACGSPPAASNDVGPSDVAQPEPVDSAQDNEQATEAEQTAGAEQTVEEEASTAVEGPDVPVLVPAGPDAPDVTFELDDGSTFVLADATRPVMLVFWAEW